MNGSILARGDITLMVNNFDSYLQLNAWDQPQNGGSDYDYRVFDQFICDNQKSSVLGFADNRYSNGADIPFIQYILDQTQACSRNITEWAYAGWNTDGNTLGTVISNSILIYLFSDSQNEVP